MNGAQRQAEQFSFFWTVHFPAFSYLSPVTTAAVPCKELQNSGVKKNDPSLVVCISFFFWNDLDHVLFQSVERRSQTVPMSQTTTSDDAHLLSTPLAGPM